MKSNRKKSLTKIAAASLIITCLLAPAGLAATYIGTGDWDTDANWSTLAEPTSADEARVEGGADVTVSLSGEVCDRYIIAQGSAGTLTITNGTLTTVSGVGHRLGQTSSGVLNISGGSLTVQNAVQTIGSGVGGHGTLNVTGGDVNFDMSLQFGNSAGNGGVINITGDAATFDVTDDVEALDKSTLNYVLGSSSVTPLTIGGDLVVYDSAKLLIDGSVYNGSTKTIPLATFNSMTQRYFDVSISGFSAGIAARVTYDSQAMNLFIFEGDFIISPNLRNGDFNDFAFPGDQDYDQTLIWENSTGLQTAIARVETDALEGHSLFIDSVGIDLPAQDTGYDIQEGDQFLVDYTWRDGTWGFEDEVQVILYVTDNDSMGGVPTILGTLYSGFSTSANSYQSASGSSPIADTSFAGKRLFVSIGVLDKDSSGDATALVDLFFLSVHNNANIPTLSEWGMILLFLVLVGLGMRQMSRSKRDQVPVPA